ncbi:hypothetical protein [Argonema galeatum]|uniref:hypothetical protein n=1 Tax=Argonema galeatum TaxID=2942762 RepID=UPI00201280D8|nr:hypothetical protein [Argonema galeatum]MCL1468167.1 hypothetical protein [Argonema galeatum A003/A1]
MTIDEQLLARVEALRIPFDDPTCPIDWKDWYHVVLLDRQGKVRILVNMNLMGRPEQGEIQVSFLVNLASEYIAPEYRGDAPMATFGTAFSLEWQPGMVRRNPFCIQGNGVLLEIDGKHSTLQVQDERMQLSIRCQGEAKATPLLVTEDSPFGSGFIGWGLVPGLQVIGELSVGGQNFSIDRDWFAYHDRNFGRFRWGEDIGWEWFVAFAVCDDGRQLTLVLDQRTNKNHSVKGFPYIFVYIDNDLHKIFLGSTLVVNWQWSPSPVMPVRLPGIMASLFADRTLKVPETLQVEADDRGDRLLLNVNFETAIELVVPDNQNRQYTFIEEVTGTVEVNLFLGGETLRAKGLLYGEYVL